MIRIAFFVCLVFLVVSLAACKKAGRRLEVELFLEIRDLS
jgi:hypothetical protein